MKKNLFLKEVPWKKLQCQSTRGTCRLGSILTLARKRQLGYFGTRLAFVTESLQLIDDRDL
uniref:Uncharacterized protein n=1 Tax=Physcomitrium patens TaxID=3218 RepID=A0A2K1KNC9_PHYPA|nr:hypothetical protein PHYPA_006175 [Physcomitrium patens]